MSNEEDVFTKQYDSPVHVWEDIDYLEDNEPVDKRTKNWKEWEKKLNYLSYLYNTKVGFLALKTTLGEKYTPISLRKRKKKKYEVC